MRAKESKKLPWTPKRGRSKVPAKLLRIIQERPGIPVTELEGRLGIGTGTMRHHLQTLQRAGKLHFVRQGRRLLIYPPGAGSDALAEGLLRGATSRAVATTIREHPGGDVASLHRLLGLSERVVYYHLQRLMEAGLVASSGENRLRDLSATGKLEALLARLEPSPTDEVSRETE